MKKKKAVIVSEEVDIEKGFSPKYMSEEEVKKIVKPKEGKGGQTAMEIYEEKLRIRHEQREKKL